VQYLVACGLSTPELPAGCRVIADEETIAFESLWDFGTTLIARVEGSPRRAKYGLVMRRESGASSTPCPGYYGNDSDFWVTRLDG